MTPSAPHAALWGVVLVGGRSSRMGRDKAALPHPAGGTFLDHAVERLLRLDCPVILSGMETVPDRWAAQRSVVSLPDAPASDTPQAGPVSGIAASLLYASAAGALGVLVTPVDMPYLTGDHLRPLLDSARQHFTSECAEPQPLIGSFDGTHREPLVAAYPAAALEPLRLLAAAPDRSLNRWLAGYPHQLHPLPPAAAANINTPTQYDSVFDQ